MDDYPSSFDGLSPPGVDGNRAEESRDAPLIPDHHLLRLIGRGSYGDVWLARSIMGVYRAVKIVYRKSFADARPFQRELSGIRKFEPISRSHEGFIDILHVGLNEPQGYFYYVMELGDDRNSGTQIDPTQYSSKTLANELSPHGHLSYQSCLQLGLDLSRALIELHRNGLVHRDVKPSNIIFVSGVPKLADIGLVAGTDETHSYVGTEGFIPPEGPGTARADVYALGKVLYEAFTGKDRHDFPELPDEWGQRPDHQQCLELNEVILHACRTGENRRYETAKEMHADLVVLLHGQSVRRLKSLERRFSRFKRIGAIAALVTATAAIIAFPFFREWQIEAHARDRQVGANVAYGNRAIEAGELLDSLPYFAEALALDQHNQRRATLHRIRIASVLAQCPRITQMLFLSNEVRVASFSPDGRYILTAEWTGKAQIFNIQTGQPVTPKFGQPDGILWASYSPDGNMVATAGQDTNACLWAASNGAFIKSLPHPGQVLCVNFSPDGAHLVTGCNDGVARVWSTTNWQCERMLTGHTAAVAYAIYSHNGQVIATASHDYTARLWNATTGRDLGAPLHHLNWVQSVAFSPDDALIATACDDRKARIWTVPKGEPVLPNLKHADVVMGVDFSPDGLFIITAGLDGTVRIWQNEDHQPAMPNAVLPHSDRVNHASFASDGHRIVTACLDGSVRIWDLAATTPKPAIVAGLLSDDRTRFLTITNNTLRIWDTLSNLAISPPIQPTYPVAESSLSPNGRFLLTLSARTISGESMNTLEVWGAKTGGRMGPGQATTNSLANISLSLDGTRLLILSGRAAEVWDVATGARLAWRVAPGKALQFASFNPSGDSIISWSTNDHDALLWNAVSGKKLLLQQEFPIKAAEFSHDGRRLVICSADDGLSHCYAQVWDTASGEPIGSPLTHGDGVLCASFSQQGSRVVTGGEDFKAKVWDIIASRALAVVTHEDKVNAVGFSSDAAWFVTASSDRTAGIWSSETGEPLTPLLRHHTKLIDVKFLNDNRSIVTSDAEGRASIWKLPSNDTPVPQLLKLAQVAAGRSISGSGGLNSLDPLSLRESWNELRLAQPLLSGASDDTVAGWHEFQAEESELSQQWSAAAFHLEHLFRMHPTDASIAKRLARAKAQLENFKTASRP